MVLSLSLAGDPLTSGAGSFLDNGAGSKAYALGNAEGANYGDIWSGFYNPAGVASVPKLTVSEMEQKLFEDSSYQAYGLAFPFLFLSCGLQYHSVKTNDIPYSGLDGNGVPVLIGPNFSVESSALILSLAKDIHLNRQSMVVFGVNAKAIREDLFYNQGLGYGADAGMILRFGNYQIGVSAINVIAPKMTWNTSSNATESLPMTLIGAFQYSSTDKLMTCMASAQKQDGQEATFHVGMSYSLFHVIDLRMGSNNGNPSYGVGMDIGGIKIDYGIQTNAKADELNSVSRLTIGYTL